MTQPSTPHSENLVPRELTENSPYFSLIRYFIPNEPSRKKTLNTLNRQLKNKNPYQVYKEAWILKLIYEQISSRPRAEHADWRPKFHPSKAEFSESRIPELLKFLSLEQQWILITLDRLEFSLENVAMSLNLQTEAILLQRRHAYESLERWIWEAK